MSDPCPKMVIRRATIEDAPALSDLAARTFVEAFADDNTHEDMARYLAESFSPEIQRGEIVDPKNVILLAHETGPAVAPLGYAHLVFGDDRSALLKRLYLLAGAKGRGLGRSLFERGVAECAARNVERMWLTVWEHNTTAIAFYERCGFRRTGSTTFQLGSDLQTDHVMQINIPRRRAEGGGGPT